METNLQKNFIKNSIITKLGASGYFWKFGLRFRSLSLLMVCKRLFSYSLANDDNTVIIGAYGDDDFGQCSVQHIYLPVTTKPHGNNKLNSLPQMHRRMLGLVTLFVLR